MFKETTKLVYSHNSKALWHFLFGMVQGSQNNKAKLQSNMKTVTQATSTTCLQLIINTWCHKSLYKILVLIFSMCIQFHCKILSNASNLPSRQPLQSYKSHLSNDTKIIKFKQFGAILWTILVAMIFPLYYHVTFWLLLLHHQYMKSINICVTIAIL